MHNRKSNTVNWAETGLNWQREPRARNSATMRIEKFPGNILTVELSARLFDLRFWAASS